MAMRMAIRSVCVCTLLGFFNGGGLKIGYFRDRADVG